MQGGLGIALAGEHLCRGIENALALFQRAGARPPCGAGPHPFPVEIVATLLAAASPSLQIKL
jgi:hypothetical protein